MTNTLYDLPIGETAAVREIVGSEELRRHLEDIGIFPGTLLSCVGQSPKGDPKAYLIRGTVIALRRTDTKKIIMEASHGIDH